MNNFHGAYKQHSFFEGWYLKHQHEGRTLAVIPSFHLDSDGSSFASLQVITNDSAHGLVFSAEEFKVHPHKFLVRVGSNVFSEKGIHLDIEIEGLSATGHLAYGPFTPLGWDLMGPFRFLPMQCNHGVVSLTHSLRGKLTVNGEILDFTGGTGYIEKDWGSSFPAGYLWSQCNWREEGDCAVMVSVADIPLLGSSFTGCLAVVWYGGVEYRFATYLGVRVCTLSPTQLVLVQREMQLFVKLLEPCPHGLKAPQQGGMTRTIHESPACRVQYRFSRRGRVIFDRVAENAGFEQDEGAPPTPDPAAAPAP